MSWAIIMIYINYITNYLVISSLEKDHSMIETRRLKIIVIFIVPILSFALSRKIIKFNVQPTKGHYNNFQSSNFAFL